MRLRVLGYHGGNSCQHRNVSFLLNEQVALDAGSLAGGLTVQEQEAVRVALITHSHLDHIADLGAMSEVRAQSGGFPLIVAGRAETVSALRVHFFNNVLWPDFTYIPQPDAPAVQLRELDLETPVELCGLQVCAVSVPHAVPACGFIISDESGSIAYTGDSGPTSRFWELLNQRDDVRLVIAEVSFPERHAALAELSGHMTPSGFAREIAKLDRRRGIPVRLFGLKPAFDAEIRSEVAALGLEGVQVFTEGEQWNT
jgi:3',5'-cyclic-nucleotide phosphodiesterase